MGSNTHEYLVEARRHIEAALITERETGAAEAIIERAVKAQEELNRVVLIQRAMLSHRSGADFPPDEA